ncbi:hypothetical protein [Streptomyces massasporeus]|uniref:hypothetical protein n=1 Tax=Streptomyces massasporeus TaxID=67324 RepID=UPI0033E613DC
MVDPTLSGELATAAHDTPVPESAFAAEQLFVTAVSTRLAHSTFRFTPRSLSRTTP